MQPQFNFRTTVRCFMEIAAIIQGFSLILMMGNGWVQEMGSNEEQPLRRFAVWIGSSLRGIFSSLLPFLAKRKNRSMEEIWDMETTPKLPTRWWVVLGWIYFAASFLQEWNAYQRARNRPVSPSTSAILQRPTGPKAVAAEGDAAGGAAGGKGSNIVDFYLQKQQEMYRQKQGSQPGAPSIGTAGGYAQLPRVTASSVASPASDAAPGGAEVDKG